MADKMQGMYIHMHWGYNHPYAARTWHMDDWRYYLSGIKKLGYNLVQIWPMLDTMPLPLTPSDEAHLRKLQHVIELAHREFDMAVWIVLCANTMGNAAAADYAFEERPYFSTERRINPADAAARQKLLATRRVFLQPLREADGFSIIDSDPGGYEGSSVSEFVQLLADHRQLLGELRPGILLNYWMWQGWRDPDKPPPVGEAYLAPWREALRGLAELNPEPWGLLACCREHFQVIREIHLQDRTLYFPYGTIEDEPSFPLTNCDIPRIARAFSPQSPPAGDPANYPGGVMANAQSHCLQLPGTYLFAQFAQGQRPDEASVVEFAERLIIGMGKHVAEAWCALSSDDQDRVLEARNRMTAAHAPIVRVGDLSGLLLDDPARFLDSLVMQLDCVSAALAANAVLDRSGDPLAAARELYRATTAWADRVGFRDYYQGPFRRLLHPVLARLAERLAHGAHLAAALAEFDALQRRHGPERHGAFVRLMAGFKAALGE